MAISKVLVVDTSEEFREAVCKLLQGEYLVKSCNDGNQALNILRKTPPDALVLDLMLPGTDGISLLRQYKDERPEDASWPVIIALTRFASKYVYSATEDLDIKYMMLKPCNPEAVVSHVVRLCEKPGKVLYTQPDQRALVTNLLRGLGIPIKRAGYGFLREAVILKMRDCRQPLMKELYPAIGKVYNATVNQVERNIRGAIEAAWQQHDTPIWAELFPPQPGGKMTRPTNAEFISRLADYLQAGQVFPQEEQRHTG